MIPRSAKPPFTMMTFSMSKRSFLSLDSLYRLYAMTIKRSTVLSALLKRAMTKSISIRNVIIFLYLISQLFCQNGFYTTIIPYYVKFINSIYHVFHLLVSFLRSSPLSSFSIFSTASSYSIFSFSANNFKTFSALYS